MEDWKMELFMIGFVNTMEDRETLRDRDDDSENIREGLRRWRRVSVPQYEAALTAASGDGGDAACAAQLHKPLCPPTPSQVRTLN
jgi:hypothetical protein